MTSPPAIPSLESRIAEARAFAILAHGDQLYGKKPYVVHLDLVLDLAIAYGLSETACVAAPLHDTLEDTSTVQADLEARFGQEAADQVDSVSGEGATRREQRASIVAKLTARPDHAPLKLVDRLANVLLSIEDGRQDLLDMYRKEMPDYAPVFANAHPVAYQRLCSLLNWHPA